MNDYAEAIFIVSVVAIICLSVFVYTGTPDIHDGIIYSLCDDRCVSLTEEPGNE
jgi:hypothetical protein